MKDAYLQYMPFFMVVDTVDLPPALVQVFVVLYSTVK